MLPTGTVGPEAWKANLDSLKNLEDHLQTPSLFFSQFVNLSIPFWTADSLHKNTRVTVAKEFPPHLPPAPLESEDGQASN